MEAECKVEPGDGGEPQLYLDIAEEPLLYRRKAATGPSGECLALLLFYQELPNTLYTELL